jgi:hypothetical protein
MEEGGARKALKINSTRNFISLVQRVVKAIVAKVKE